MYNNSLKILICDDQDSDAFVITRNIEKAGFLVEFERVESAEELKDALLQKKWDLIICDYNIPGFGGHEALELVKSIDRDTPFILVSGMVGESTAVEMMRAGASDYLMKDSLAKLSEVVKRVIEEAKVRKERYDALEEIRINEQKHKAVIDNSLFAILIAPSNGNIIESNKAASDLFGYTENEFRNLSREDLLDINAPNFQHQVMQRDLYGSVRGEFIGIKKGGKKFHCELASVLFKDVKGNTLTSTMISDITERKLFEESLLKSKALLKKAEAVANIGSVEIDLKTGERIWSDGFYILLGLEPQSQTPSLKLFLDMLSPEIREKYVKWYYEVVNLEKEISSIEVELLRNKDDRRIFTINAIGFKDQSGVASKLIVVIQDVTEQKLINLNLEKQNAQLKEIAWAQSHLVRAPLSRLMGLVNALERDIVPADEQKKYLHYVKISAAELDGVIKEITKKAFE